MKKLLSVVGVVLAIAIAAAAAWWVGEKNGWLGTERGPGEITGKAIPADVVAARAGAIAEQAPAGETDQILFGDLHVHTTYSTDAFMWALPMLGGPGVHPVGDACDFARYCSGLDFWAITDHAESGTPFRWRETKKSIRQCQAVSGDSRSPDLVSFIGFEWTQVGRIPSEHYGHKNVIFENLGDSDVAAREIAAAGVASATLRTSAKGLSPLLALEDLPERSAYYDFNRFIKNIQRVPACDPTLSSDKLPADCYEQAATPGELVRRLDQQGLKPLIIPHGSSWGFYTPAGTTWDKSLAPAEDPGTFRLIEIYSGHGNSEEYRNWKEVLPNPDGTSATCPPPSANYLPSCWRAGEIIMDRCLKTGQADAVCAKRADEARLAYANMGIAGHLAIGGETPEDWLDAGQCTDCFLPPVQSQARNLGAVRARGIALRRGPEAPDPIPLGLHRFLRQPPRAPRDRLQAGRPAREHRGERRRGREDAAAAARRPGHGRCVPARDPPGAVAEDGRLPAHGVRTADVVLPDRGPRRACTLPADRARRSGTRSQRREVYATSGHKILLWFDASDASSGKAAHMGGELDTAESPTFTVRAVGSFKQKPGCPDFAKAGMDATRLQTLCSGECDNPSDVRNLITRIEVVRIRPQATPGEPIDGLIEDKFLVHECPPSPNGCNFSFTDPGYGSGGRDAIYYVRAIEEAQPTINAQPIQCERDASGRCIKAKLCYGDYRSGASDCTSPSEPRAWSSPIYLYHPAAGSRG